MAKSKETFNKKEKEKKRFLQKQDKQQRKDERKNNSKKGAPLEDMMAYLDENGNLSDTPPDPRARKVFKQEDIQIGVPKYVEQDQEPRTGEVSFFDDTKGFGFIIDKQTNERVFVHANNLTEKIKVADKVSFEVEMGARGPSAIQVKKIN